MSKPKSDAVIAVVNSSEDTVEMLREMFRAERVHQRRHRAHHDFKTGEVISCVSLPSRSRRHRLRRFDPL